MKGPRPDGHSGELTDERRDTQTEEEWTGGQTVMKGPRPDGHGGELTDERTDIQQEEGWTGGQTADNLTLVLIGLSGHGKSSTGTNILGQDKFAYGKRASTVTKTCQKETSEALTVIDTPPLDEPANVGHINSYIKHLAPPTILVLVIGTTGTRWTTEMEQCLNNFDWKRSALVRYILLTGISDDSKKEEFLNGSEHTTFNYLIQIFGGKENILFLDNKVDGDTTGDQVRAIIDNMRKDTSQRKQCAYFKRL